MDSPAPRWHALSPGTDLNKPPAEARGAGGGIAPWQPYRLFPTHQPRQGTQILPATDIQRISNPRILSILS